MRDHPALSTLALLPTRLLAKRQVIALTGALIRLILISDERPIVQRAIVVLLPINADTTIRCAYFSVSGKKTRWQVLALNSDELFGTSVNGCTSEIKAV